MTDKKPESPLATSSVILQLLGMSQPEAVEYLSARGVKVSLGAVKAWGRGHYKFPNDALIELWLLWKQVSAGDWRNLPEHTPDNVRARAGVINDVEVVFGILKKLRKIE